MRFQYERDTKLLTLIDAEQEEEIVTVALSWMEEDQEIVNITAGEISEFLPHHIIPLFSKETIKYFGHFIC